MTEKILQQKLRKITLLVLAIFSLAAFVIHVFEDRSYTGTLNLYSPGAESARYEFSDDAVVSLTSFTQTENTITYTVEPLSMGYTDLTFFDSVSRE